MVYSCSKKDLLETINLISETIAAITNEDDIEINKINNDNVSSNKIRKEKIRKYLNDKKLWKYKLILNDLIYIEDITIKFFEKQSYSPIISIYEIIDFKIFKEMLLEDGVLIADNEIVANEFLNINRTSPHMY